MLFLRLHPSTAFQTLVEYDGYSISDASYQSSVWDGRWAFLPALHSYRFTFPPSLQPSWSEENTGPRGAVPCLSCAFSLSWVALNTSYTGDKMEHIWSFYIFTLFTVSNVFFILCSQCCYILFSLFQNSSLLASMGVFRDISHSEPKHILCLFLIGNWLLI